MRGDLVMKRVRRIATSSDAGFTLLEILLVVTILGVIAATAVPSLIRARASAEETATIAALRTLVTAQGTFAATCTNGFYAPSMPWLARVPNQQARTPFIGPPFTANVTDRYGYRIRFTAGPRAPAATASCNGLRNGQSVGSYFFAADVLVARGRVTRFFGVNQSGTIYQSTRRISPFYTGRPPAPARPIG